MGQEKKKCWCLALLIVFTYIGGAFITNAYCQVYRWEAWKEDWDNMDHESKLPGSVHANQNTGLATVFWPVYVASKMCIEGMECIKFVQENKDGS